MYTPCWLQFLQPLAKLCLALCCWRFRQFSKLCHDSLEPCVWMNPWDIRCSQSASKNQSSPTRQLLEISCIHACVSCLSLLHCTQCGGFITANYKLRHIWIKNLTSQPSKSCQYVVLQSLRPHARSRCWVWYLGRNTGDLWLFTNSAATKPKTMAAQIADHVLCNHIFRISHTGHREYCCMDWQCPLASNTDRNLDTHLNIHTSRLSPQAMNSWQ